MPAYSPGGMLIAFASPPSPFPGRTAGIHRLLRGLPGYLILFDTHAFVPQRQSGAGTLPFAIGVLRDIYAFHRYTAHSAYFSPSLVRQFQRLAGVEPRAFTADFPDRLRTPLNPINPDNARILRITAAAGTGVSRCFSSGTLTQRHTWRPLFPDKEVYDAWRLLPSRGLAGSGSRPLTNIPHCCLP